MARIVPGPTDVLLVVDVQYDFVPGGALAVAAGDEVIPLVNALAARFEHVVFTQDWHPRGHISFASAHPGRSVLETITLPYGDQVLWPDHCVQGTPGAELHRALAVPHAELIVRKGYHRAVDSYSAFREADRRTPTGLTGYLRERGLRHAYMVGLATDFCVAWSARDAREAGFAATVVDDACRAIDTGGSLAQAWADMTAAGVVRARAADLLG